MSFKELSSLPKEMIEPILFKMPFREVENINLTCSKMHQTVQKLRNKLFSRKTIGLTIGIRNFEFWWRISGREMWLPLRDAERLLSDAFVYFIVVDITPRSRGVVSDLVDFLNGLKISCVTAEIRAEDPNDIVATAQKINCKTTIRIRSAWHDDTTLNDEYHIRRCKVLAEAENCSSFEYRVVSPKNVDINRLFDSVKNFRKFEVVESDSDQFYAFLDQLRHAPNCNLKHFQTSGITTRFEDYIWKPPSTSLWDMSLIPVIYLQRSIMDYIQKIDFVPPCGKCILVGKALFKKDDSLRVVRNNSEEILDTVLKMVNIRMNIKYRSAYLNSWDEQEKREILWKTFMAAAPSPFEHDGSSEENADEG